MNSPLFLAPRLPLACYDSMINLNTAARFLEHLEGAGCNVTPQLRRSVTEYAMLATLTVMAVEL